MKKWVAKFKRGRDSTKDYQRSGHPKTSTTDKQIDAIHRMVLNDNHLIIQLRAKSIGIRSGSVHSVSTDLVGEQAASKIGAKNTDTRAQLESN